MRQLATIQQIKSLEPIEGADRVVLAKLDNLAWQLVTNKENGFNVGDKCIYFEIDSILPKENPEFAFLEGRRIKTKNIRKKLSQGLIVPLKVLPAGDYPIGTDVSDLLGVIKWEPTMPKVLSGEALGLFPNYIRKTDETRIQSHPRLIEEMQGMLVYVTVKCDGSSMTAYVNKDHFGVCSRNIELKESENAYWRLARKYDLEKKLRSLGSNVAVQMELCGPGIQKNRLGMEDLEAFVFNWWNIDEQKYFNYDKAVITSDQLSLPRVPLVTIEEFRWQTVDQLLELAKGIYPNTKLPREGIVIRPVSETYSNVLDSRMSFKVINNEFLLVEED